jgi:hypothetical protein
MRRIIINWLERHRSRTSQILHAIGIPMLVAAMVLAVVQLIQWRWDLWWRPAALFIASYVLQWLGHVAEGNDMGEVVLIKKMLGKPYVAISPRYRKDAER